MLEALLMDGIPDFLQPLEYFIHPYPKDAVAAAIRRQEESTPCLLQALEEAAAHPEQVTQEYQLHWYALHLLAFFREKAGYRAAVTIARHPLVADVIGDLVIHSFGPILASLAGDDASLIKELIEDKEAAEDARASGVDALAAMCLADRISSHELSEYFGGLIRGGMVRDEPILSEEILQVCADLRLNGLLPDLRKLREEGCIFEEEWASAERRMAGEEDVETSAYRLIDDVMDELSFWDHFGGGADPLLWNDTLDSFPGFMDGESFTPADLADESLFLASAPQPPQQPTRVEQKPGRNEPCPCGSGKKYKKCCG